MQRPIEIVEVGPRDGLQNETAVLATAAKLELIEQLLEAGLRRIEVASFVHPERVPQMADAEAVIAGLPDRPGVRYTGLCLNKRGLLRALETREGGRRGVDEVGCVLVVTDSFGLRNQGQTVEEGLRENIAMLAMASSEGLRAQVTLSAAFGCPFEGEVAPAAVAALAARLAEAGPAEIALADTIGVATPVQVRDLIGLVREAAPGVPLRAHFHNTRNTGLANVWAAVEAGVSIIDCSIAGLGGCPFAPKATGNVPTEDVVYLLERSGCSTGLDLSRLIAASHFIGAQLGRELPGLVSRAGAFPPPAPAQ